MKAVLFGVGGPTEPRAYPLYQDSVAAGFPSPAQDYVEQQLDLNEFCVRRPAATFFVRAEGDSMKDAGILSGDVLVVDRSVRPQHGDIVIAAINNDFTVKQLELKPKPRLVPRNSRYPVIELSDESELEVFGVVVSVVRNMRRGE